MKSLPYLALCGLACFALWMQSRENERWRKEFWQGSPPEEDAKPAEDEEEDWLDQLTRQRKQGDLNN